MTVSKVTLYSAFSLQTSNALNTLVLRKLKLLSSVTVCTAEHSRPRMSPGSELIRQDCSSSKYASIDGVEFQMWRNTFKTATMTSFHSARYSKLHKAKIHRTSFSVASP